MLSILLQVGILNGIFCFCISSISCSDESAESEKLRINGEENATFGEFKYAAFLERIAEDDYATCTGFLICDRFVLTAANCLGANDFSLQVSFRREESGMSLIKAKKWHMHERYIYGAWEYDIALIELESSATELSGVEVATLPTTHELPHLGSFVIVAGYGDEDKANSHPERYLKKASMEVSNSCKGTQYCLSATVGSGSVCVGDSVAPVVFENKVIALSFQMLLTNKCKGASGLFTTIFPFVEWINEKMMNK